MTTDDEAELAAQAVADSAEEAMVEAGVSDPQPTQESERSSPQAADSNVLDRQHFDDDDEVAQSPAERLQVVLDIPVQLSMELGRTRMSIRHLMQLNRGSVVRLDQPAGEPLDILVNGCLIARGEVVMVNERYGVRITDIVSPTERLKKL